ncbi:DUF3108 domain-containing protein [Hyphobacterium sp. HN65]|uniref:DUF3108 domain-containing protein n=1 Tax=Hyphobacterium lacteum TaxID=3116575 RepID=A0ABU7LT55_9PROT|nr:DUF3108 domain-containing protein [Hyphobacterium sp. HN65]MEE2526514.1 DUF3108 domain-containing protein [Hyphobacterium sp. HN65]
MFPWRIVAILACGLLFVPVAEANRREALSIEADYSASVLIFRVGRVSLDADLGTESYAARAHVEAAGLAALFTDFSIDSDVEGVFTDAGPRPVNYGHIERTGDKTRIVGVDFNEGVARSTATPAFSSWGDPPASEADRTGVVDPMTATLLLSELVSVSTEQPCEGSIPVFDGKQRYDLNLVSRGTDTIRTRGYRGEVLVCDAFYAPISGYDTEDWPEPGETRHPLRMWIAPIADGAFLPVRLHTRAGFGGVTVELRSLALQ